MPNPPSHTVTLLGCDLRDRTRLDAPPPPGQAESRARDAALFQQIALAHGGTAFATLDGALGSAFPTAGPALTAALAFVDHCAAQPDPSLAAPLALHSGPLLERAGTYGGPTVVHLSGLLTAAHPGQILLSATAAAALAPAAPPGVVLQDLGEHRLKDLLPRARLFQVRHPAHPASFPPPRTLDQLPNNLTSQPYPLIGREPQLAAAARLLRQPAVRLLILTGPSGTGKTRLALQIAADLLADVPDGAWFVPLGTIADAALVPTTIAQTLGIKESAGRPLLDLLQEELRDQHLLLLLDNFEQVAAAAPMVESLLAAAPGLKLLVTSRAAHHFAAETPFPVPPLDLPDLDHLPPLATLVQVEAIALFTARAQDVQPGFALTAHNAPPVAAICAHLDGLPLAIELAAARSKEFSPADLLQRLRGSTGPGTLGTLTRGAAYGPARQHTLRGAIGWSYNLLAPAEQALFARLGVFVGAATLDAVAAVCNGQQHTSGEMVAQLTGLIDKSLLRREERDESRFGMLGTIREYAWERLEETGEAEARQARHAAYYLALAEQVEPELRSAHPESGLARLALEHDNLRAALAWAVRRAAAETACRLSGALAWFWRLSSHVSEGRHWVAAALALAPTADPPLPAGVRAKVLYAAGLLASMDSDLAGALAWLEQSLVLYRELGDKAGCGRVLTRLLWVQGLRRDFPAAAAAGAEALALWRELGNQRGLGICYYYLGAVAAWHADPDQAALYHAEALRLAQELGDQQTQADALTGLGDVARLRGDYGQAAAHYGASLALFRALNGKTEVTMALHNLGQTALHQGALEQARQYFAEGLGRDPRLGDKIELVACLAGLGEVAAGQGQPARAVRLLSAARAGLAALNQHLTPKDQAPLDQALALGRAALDPPAFAAAWAAGQALTLEQAIAYATGA
ncbi:MAG TPA: tetratricopeptide repeat protein [Chloroflexia bacterium]|nr:tetratricopeptide repeat protein [Chloroflexia bacterium]